MHRITPIAMEASSPPSAIHMGFALVYVLFLIIAAQRRGCKHRPLC